MNKNQTCRGNCRSAQSLEFRRNIRSLLDYHRLYLVALLETHITDHHVLREDFQFSDMTQVSAEGQSGGIVPLLHREALTVDILATTRQEVHCIIKVNPHPQ